MVVEKRLKNVMEWGNINENWGKFWKKLTKCKMGWKEIGSFPNWDRDVYSRGYKEWNGEMKFINNSHNII